MVKEYHVLYAPKTDHGLYLFFSALMVSRLYRFLNAVTTMTSQSLVEFGDFDVNDRYKCSKDALQELIKYKRWQYVRLLNLQSS